MVCVDFYRWFDLNQRSVRLSTLQNNSLPAFYGKSSKNPYYSPLFDFIVGKALDLRKATSSLCLNPSEIKKTAMNLINAVLISEWHNVLRVTVTGLSYPAISLTKLKCHPTNLFKSINEYQSNPDFSSYSLVPRDTLSSPPVRHTSCPL